MKKLKLGILLISALVFQGLSAASYSETEAAIEHSILKNINRYRLAKGLNALQLNPVISAQAKQHSADMAQHRLRFGHDYFSDRIKKIYSRIPHCNGGAENIAFNYRDGNVVVKQWLSSPGHKRNIDGNYNLTGIGVSRDANGKMYFTQLFIKTNARIG